MYKMGIEELEKVGLSFDIINAQQLFFYKAHFFSGIVTNRKKI